MEDLHPQLGRRTFITGVLFSSTTGCLDRINGSNPKTATTEIPKLPVHRSTVPLSYDLDEIEENIVEVVAQDAIPSIDEPQFTKSPSESDYLRLSDSQTVFGAAVNGEARAYPRYILTWHEIVNDTIGGEGIAITYCPLTGSAVGFKRDNVEFGVSGLLVNNNLIMYDRGTESRWPQILGRSIQGPYRGQSLQEIQITWTTWGDWKKAHPDTVVLTENTGAARNYGRDPYVEDGIYSSRQLAFPVMYQNDDYHPKKTVIGARSKHGALAVFKDTLREEQLIELTLNEVPYVAVYDALLDTGYVYENTREINLRTEGNEFRTSDGEVYSAANLPLASINTFDAMWFAWYGFYPDTVIYD